MALSEDPQYGNISSSNIQPATSGKKGATFGHPAPTKDEDGFSITFELAADFQREKQARLKLEEDLAHQYFCSGERTNMICNLRSTHSSGTIPLCHGNQIITAGAVSSKNEFMYLFFNP